MISKLFIFSLNLEGKFGVIHQRRQLRTAVGNKAWFQTLDSQRVSHIWRSRVNYGVLIVHVLVKTVRFWRGKHSTEQFNEITVYVIITTVVASTATFGERDEHDQSENV